MWRKAYDAAEAVIKGDVKTLATRRKSALTTFASEYGITAEEVFGALQIGGEADIDLELLTTLTALRTSIKNGEATVEELFKKPQPKVSKPKGLAGRLDEVAGVPPHDSETGEIISDEMAARAHEKTKLYEEAVAALAAEKTKESK